MAWKDKVSPEYREKNRMRCKAYHDNHRREHKARCKERYWANPEKSKLASMAWYEKNKDAHLARSRAYTKQNWDYLLWSKRAYDRKRRAEDPSFRITKALRERLRTACKRRNAKKRYKTLDVIGCSIAELFAHLESQFLPGMTWNNYGDWHIDHKLPCSAFNLLDPDEQRRCFHFSNLQPLWGVDNNRKNDLLPDGTRGRSLKTINRKPLN